MDRGIRVFVSSTFRDLQVERDLLVKRVFPQLRRRCESRGVTWGEVDLRWGITDEQRAEGRVLPLCLAEIQRCRPYFIGILGERYGWVPEELPPELLASEPWLADFAGRSVTELEILHGVLNDPAMEGQAYFYFRDPAFPGDVADAREDRARLEALKERIRRSGFPVREPYPDPAALADLVQSDFEALIDRLFPPGAEVSPLDRQLAEQQAFSARRSRVFVGLEARAAPLQAVARGEAGPVVLAGAAGSGKSALLASWLASEARGVDVVPIVHHVGASAGDGDWATMLTRLLGEFRRSLAIDVPIPADRHELPDAFGQALEAAALQGRLLLVIDGIDQLDDREGAQELAWLPRQVPAGLRLIMSAGPGRAQDAVRRRGWMVTPIAPLSRPERLELVGRFLSQYAKTLAPDLAESLADHAGCGNPLFLTTVLDELRQHGSHETVAGALDHYLAASTPARLFGLVLARWEVDFSKERPHLVRDACRVLWAARRGVSEAELLDMLGAGTRLARAFWTPFFLAAEQGLGNRSGRLALAHDALREAVRRRYLGTGERRRAAHRELARYFQASGPGWRTYEELPWQLEQAGDLDGLRDLLADPAFVSAAWETHEFEIKRAWASLERATGRGLLEAFAAVLADPDRHSASLHPIAALLADTGHLKEAAALRDHMAARYRQAGNDADLQAVLGDLGLVAISQGRLADAERLLAEQVEICLRLDQAIALQAAFGNLALVPLAHGEREQARALLVEQESICRQHRLGQWLQACLGNQAAVLIGLGDHAEAWALLEEQEALCRQHDDLASLQVCLGNQALIVAGRGAHDEALGLRREQERLCRSTGNLDGLQRCLGSQALILRSVGQLAGADALLAEQEALCRRAGLKAGLATALGNRALLCHSRAAWDEALALHREEEALWRDLGSADGLRVCLGNQALVHLEWGNLELARELVAEQERLARETGSRDGLRIALDNRGLVLRELGDFEGALAAHLEQEALARDLASPGGLQEALGNRGIVHMLLGEADVALALLAEQEAICREIGDPEGLARSLWYQASALAALDRLVEARFLIAQAERIATEHHLLAILLQMAPDVAALQA
ncbi:MAG: DUF4062 domain-containing protein [Candidatus Sericytochromatia bacterium]|nr:DUF4062 domain-containing protein [Candidatus Tanganyikabacteria bacterium]